MSAALAPRRFQRSRKRGWRKPHNAVVVDRTSKWGNPYAARDLGDCEPALLVALYRDWLRSDDAKAIRLRRQLPALRGKNLLCWCRLDAPCHADVLLELANRPPALPDIPTLRPQREMTPAQWSEFLRLREPARSIRKRA